MTKKVLFPLFLMVLSLPLLAQPSKGSWMLGGDARALGDLGNRQNGTLSMNPYAGYFLSERFAVGAAAGFFSSQIGEQFQFSGFQVAPFARYYVPLKNPKLALLFEGRGSYSSTSSNIATGDSWGLQGSGGLSAFLAPSLAIESALNVSSTFPEDGLTRTSLGLRLGLQAFLHQHQEGGRETPGSEYLRKGSFLLGMSNDLSRTSSDARFDPALIYMLSNRLGLGAGISSPFTEFSLGEGPLTTSISGLIPALRYFPGSKADARLRTFGGLGSTFRWEYNREAPNTFALNPYAEVGAMYFLSKNLALDASLMQEAEIVRLGRRAFSRPDLRFKIGFQYVIPTMK